MILMLKYFNQSEKFLPFVSLFKGKSREPEIRAYRVSFDKIDQSIYIKKLTRTLHTFRFSINAFRMSLRTKLLNVKGLTVFIHMSDNVSIFIALEPASLQVESYRNITFQQLL
jgi:hypothetical protein